jgi:hypothetical protein
MSGKQELIAKIEISGSAEILLIFNFIHPVKKDLHKSQFQSYDFNRVEPRQRDNGPEILLPVIP